MAHYTLTDTDDVATQTVTGISEQTSTWMELQLHSDDFE
jgi:hypothetical protein